MKIEADKQDETQADGPSLALINKKLEAFVEVVLGKLIELQQENRDIKRRLAAVEAQNTKLKLYGQK